MIHRDVKPSNLLVDGRGTVWVADFGLARRIADPSMTQTESLIGTPRYMSPEQAVQGPIDVLTDVYSLGATLYELLTLRPPHDGRTTAELIGQIRDREPVSPRKLDARLPRDLETIVLKAMAKRPSDRYASADELADDLQRFLAHRAGEGPADRPGRPGLAVRAEAPEPHGRLDDRRGVDPGDGHDRLRPRGAGEEQGAEGPGRREARPRAS